MKFQRKSGKPGRKVTLSKTKKYWQFKKKLNK